MGPVEIYRATLPDADLNGIEVGAYLRVLAIDRTRSEFVFEIARPTYRKLRLRDFIFGTEPQAVIMVKR